MSEPWYQVIDAPQPPSQRDLILDCPVLVWKRLDTPTPTALTDRAALLREDVVVMTQVCDLEHHKVRDVVLCRHIPLSAYRKRDWEPWMAARSQASSEKAWRRFCEIRLDNFHTVFTVPRDFLETLLRDRGQARRRSPE